MDKPVTFSGDLVPESTDVALQKTESSPARRSGDSALGAPRPSSTRSERGYSESDVRKLLQTIGGLQSKGFTSSDAFALLLYALTKCGYEEEACWLAEGFCDNRGPAMQDFMG